jgi:hypothetical protein
MAFYNANTFAINGNIKQWIAMFAMFSLDEAGSESIQMKGISQT